MKRIIPILLLLTLFCFSASCEKDDICVDGDTPLLVIAFFDIEDTLLRKDVPSLRIRALNISEPLDGENSTRSDRATKDSVVVPLQIDASSTSFEFINNSADDDEMMETGNIDTLTFNYSVSEKYISRACGFIANYSGLDTTRTVTGSDWIQRIEIVDTLIENSNNIHVKIFH